VHLRCQYAQGYLFSRPVPLEEALAIAEAGGRVVAAAEGCSRG